MRRSARSVSALTCFVAVGLICAGNAFASSAGPNPVNFGNVPINTTVSTTVTITVDAGYRTEVASGSGLNAPFGFDFGSCGAGGGFTGPGTCTVTERFSPTSVAAASGTTNVFECPVAGGSCIGIPFDVQGAGVSVASASPNPVGFGNVPINTTVSTSVTITVDAGYRTEVASGSGLNAPFGFDFGSCGAGGGFTGPGTCTVTERFAPTSVAAASGTTNVFECPVAGGSCIGIPFDVSGTGVSLASATPNPVDYGDVPINTTATSTVTITVDTGYRTEVASGSGLNAPFAFDFGSCGAGGGFTGPGTCTVSERYTPTAVGPNSGTTNVFECPVVGGTCIGIPFNVQGNGVSQASASPNPVSFGNVPINTTVSASVTIHVDVGYRTEVASGSGLNAPFAFDFDTCGAGGGFTGPGTCTVTERYTPTVVGPNNGTTNVFECPVVGGTCIGIPFNVSGAGVSAASATPNPVSFGSVPINTTASAPVTITVDAGYRTEVASGSGLNAPFAFDFDTCGTGGGFTGPGTCTVTERYTPTAVGPNNGTTNVFECPVVGGTCIGIPFNVTGAGVSAASATPNPVSFGSVPINTTVSAPVTITVDSGYQAEIATGTGINVPFGFDFGTCSGAGGIGPGTCTVNESYTPTAVGPNNGTTTVFECPVAGGSCLPIPFDVSGAGVSVAAASPSAVDFGEVSLGTTKTMPVTITADTGYTVQLASGSGLNPPFSFAFGTCASFAGPGDCIVQETFAPTAVGPASGTLSVFECPTAGGTCIGIPVSLTGSGVLNATATTIASSQNPSKVGQAVTFTATVTAATGPTPITGSVAFSDGSTVLGTVPLASNGTASLTTSSLAFGSHTITAAYAGDSAHGTSSAGLTQTVQRLRTSTSLRSSDRDSNVGQAVTFTATVSGPGGTPTGTVTFADGSTTLGTVPLSGGRASLTTSALTHGDHDITASYSGDATYAPSSDDVNQHVRRNASNTSLKASPNPSSPGQPVTFTATVSASGPTPTGTVTFTDGSHTLGAVTLSGGTASLTTSTLSTGVHFIRASYSGSDADLPSSDTVTQIVRRR